MTEEYDLKKSVQALGVLVPIIKNKRTGHIIDGKHRGDIDPKAPVYEIDIPEDLEPIARLTINNCRRNADKDEVEWQDILSKIIGVQGKTAEQIHEDTGIGLATIYRHMPASLKDQKLSEAQKEGWRERGFSSEKPTVTIQDMTKCDWCTFPTSQPQQKEDYTLCPNCAAKTIDKPDAWSGFKQSQQRKKDGKVPPVLKPTTPREFDSWAHKESAMHQDPSKFEVDSLKLLETEEFKDLRPFSTNVTVCAVPTKPDIIFHFRQRLCAYEDGPVHKGKLLDSDDWIRAKLEEHGDKVLSWNESEGSPRDFLLKVREMKEAMQ